MSLHALREQFREEAADCDFDGSAVQAWKEAREIDSEELESTLLQILASSFTPGNNPLAGLMLAFRLGYELAVQVEREAFLGSHEDNDNERKEP